MRDKIKLLSKKRKRHSSKIRRRNPDSDWKRLSNKVCDIIRSLEKNAEEKFQKLHDALLEINESNNLSSEEKRHLLEVTSALEQNLEEIIWDISKHRTSTAIKFGCN